MSIYTATLAALEADPTIAAAWRAASPGDRSIMLTMLEFDGGEMMTSAGSANHRLWRRLEDHGWLTVTEEDESPARPFKRVSATFTELGWRAIPVILGHWGFDHGADGNPA